MPGRPIRGFGGVVTSDTLVPLMGILEMIWAVDPTIKPLYMRVKDMKELWTWPILLGTSE